jgi:hypothetical protein
MFSGIAKDPSCVYVYPCPVRISSTNIRLNFAKIAVYVLYGAARQDNTNNELEKKKW